VTADASGGAVSDEAQGDDGTPGHRAGALDDVFRLVAESSRDLILIGTVDHNEWISPSVLEILGYTPEEFLSFPGSELVHPDDRPAVEEARPIIAAGREVGGRVRVRHRDGSYRWLDSRVRPLPDPDGGFRGRSLSSWRDVTLEVEAIDRLVTSEEHYRLLVEHVSDGVVLERDGMIVWASPNIKGMLGWDPDRWVGQSLLDLVRPEIRPTVADALSVAARRQPVTFRVSVPASDGEMHWLEIAARPFIGSDGECKGNACSVRIVDAEVAAESELEHRASHDQLTGLLNRKEVLDRLDAIGTGTRHAGQETAVLFCDLDEFKAVNDTLGHSVGDRVLRIVADRVRSAVRGSDLVARIGGDELLVVLEHLHAVDEALTVADQIRVAVNAPIEVDGHELHVGVSIGVSMVTTGDSSDAVIARADAAMYMVKDGNRGPDPQLAFDV
jgi:diguanylate cyclase (GGDEF)-like protein/PAS domain S-box-containing protein